MKIPWLYIAIFLSLSIFYYFNQKIEIRREEKRDRLREAREDYLNSFLRKRQEKNDSGDKTEKKETEE